MISILFLLGSLAGPPIQELQSILRQEEDNRPINKVIEFQSALSAEEKGDLSHAVSEWDRIYKEARASSSSLFIQSAALVGKALVLGKTGNLKESSEAMLELSSLRKDNLEVQYFAELQVAITYSQGRTKNFNPTFAEVREQFQRFFSNFPQARSETIDAHLEFAGKCYLQSFRDTIDPGETISLGITHILEAKSLYDELLHENKVLAESKPSDFEADIDRFLMRQEAITEEARELSESNSASTPN